MTISPDQVVAPSPEVAERSLEIIDTLDFLRRTHGGECMSVEAMAMHNASLAMLRGDIGTSGVDQMLRHARAENDRVAARDRTTSADRRSLEANASRR